MNFKEYQEKALKTKGDYTDNIDQLINGVMGLTGESGEVIDIVKKYLYQGHELNHNKLINELGDTLWYINLIANSMNRSLEDIAKHNISKLRKRYPKGYFREEDSVNRVEE
ncbi:MULTISPECIES: nucleoside triphosphate pyrophosphohydrolase family protein [Clostridium]|uniref:nucleoside triphosphate pyrophosphohydrolase family protein n=1 Tax=Clostridium TaxID=1485 RepID=UPI000DFBE946|nr:nucleoside triphosphate pyrophosphohydrolase family protein [Clostridium sporogenes]MCW6086979.1 nucleoside triphosphate pyrophosphohydrolase family protein [Clostridium sporogenes]STC81477.1 MazG family protein [Clostridium botulinum]